MYLNTPAQPISTSVAALPLVLLQWPQLLSFVQDFELCPALISRAQLAASSASSAPAPRPSSGNGLKRMG